jgi:hypothetical protein
LQERCGRRRIRGQKHARGTASINLVHVRAQVRIRAARTQALKPGGTVVGRIFKEPAAPEGRPWMMWASGHSAATVKRAAHGYKATREAAMAAFAKSWRRSYGHARSAFHQHEERAIIRVISRQLRRRCSMVRLILASLVLAISILQSYAQGTILHRDRSGYTTGIDGSRTVNTYTDQYGNTTGWIGGKYISTYSDGYGGTRGTIGNKSINTYQDGYGNTTGTIGRDRVNTHTDPSGQTIGTIGGRRLNCYTRSRTTTCY